MAGKRRGNGPAGRPVVSDESRRRHETMLTLTEGQEEQVREAAARSGGPPERLLARAVALGLAQLAAEVQQGLEPGPGDGELTGVGIRRSWGLDVPDGLA